MRLALHSSVHASQPGIVAPRPHMARCASSQHLAGRATDRSRRHVDFRHGLMRDYAYPHLSRAPVREAVLDFRARLPEAVSDERLRTFCGSLAERYRECAPIHLFSGQIRFDEGGVAAQEQAASRCGYRLTSVDETSVLQIRRDRFTHGRIRPCECWDAMMEEAWPVWERHVKELQPVGVSRVATRFINVLPLSARKPLNQVLPSPPTLPAGISSELTAFVFRFVTERPGRIASIVSLATEEGAGLPSVLLDIDCFVRGDLSVADGNMGAVRRVLDQLRERKNKLFFAHVAAEAVKERE